MAGAGASIVTDSEARQKPITLPAPSPNSRELGSVIDGLIAAFGVFAHARVTGRRCRLLGACLVGIGG